MTGQPAPIRERRRLGDRQCDREPGRSTRHRACQYRHGRSSGHAGRLVVEHGRRQRCRPVTMAAERLHRLAGGPSADARACRPSLDGRRTTSGRTVAAHSGLTCSRAQTPRPWRQPSGRRRHRPMTSTRSPCRHPWQRRCSRCRGELEAVARRTASIAERCGRSAVVTACRRRTQRVDASRPSSPGSRPHPATSCVRCVRRRRDDLRRVEPRRRRRGGRTRRRGGRRRRRRRAARVVVVLDQRRGLRLVEVEAAVDRVGRVVVALHHVAAADLADPRLALVPVAV